MLVPGVERTAAGVMDIAVEEFCDFLSLPHDLNSKSVETLAIKSFISRPSWNLRRALPGWIIDQIRVGSEEDDWQIRISWLPRQPC